MEKGEEREIAKRAMMGGKYVEGNEKRKVQDKKNVGRIFFCALLTSRTGEVKSTTKERVNATEEERWKRKYEDTDGESRQMKEGEGQEWSNVREKREGGG